MVQEGGGSGFFSARENREIILSRIETIWHIQVNCLEVHTPWALEGLQKNPYDFSVFQYSFPEVFQARQKVAIY